MQTASHSGHGPQGALLVIAQVSQPYPTPGPRGKEQGGWGQLPRGASLGFRLTLKEKNRIEP